MLNAVASRDRGIFQTGFTLRAFASEGTRLEMTRVSLNLPFSETVSGESGGGSEAVEVADGAVVALVCRLLRL